MRTPAWKVLSICMKQQAADDETTYDIETVVEGKLLFCGERGANILDQFLGEIEKRRWSFGFLEESIIRWKE
jgi:hypothetical protein